MPKLIHHLKDNVRLTATVKCLLNEAYGDSVLCQDLCHRYSIIITVMGFKDFIEEGKRKLREKNLTIVRYHSILRIC